MRNAAKEMIFTKAGKPNKNMLNALSRCRVNDRKKHIYTGYYLGTGRHVTAHAVTADITKLLTAAGYSFGRGNDAAQGGILGEYISVTPAGLKFIKGLKDL